MGSKRPATAPHHPINATADAPDGRIAQGAGRVGPRTHRHEQMALAAADAAPGCGVGGLSVPRAELRARWFGRQGSAAMNTVMDTVSVSMMEVDAAAARAALADRLQLAPVDLEHPAVVAVLAAVVAAGWRPPSMPGGSRILTDPVEDSRYPMLFGDSDEIIAARGDAPPGGPR